MTFEPFHFAVFLLGAFGLAYIVGHSTISLPIRILLGGTKGSAEVHEGMGFVTPPKPGSFGPAGEFLCELLECPACFGFWTGLVSGLTLFSLSLGASFGLGLVVSGSNFILGRFTRLI
jgi:hypothetical protein